MTRQLEFLAIGSGPNATWVENEIQGSYSLDLIRSTDPQKGLRQMAEKLPEVIIPKIDERYAVRVIDLLRDSGYNPEPLGKLLLELVDYERMPLDPSLALAAIFELATRFGELPARTGDNRYRYETFDNNHENN